MMELKKTENIVILGVFLACIGAFAAGILAFVANMTKEPIAVMELKKINQALGKVLPEFDNIPANNKITVKSADKEEFPVTFFAARLKGKLVAIAGQSYTKKGYAGKIEAMVGLDIDGAIRTVIITKQKETPGLGTVVCGRKREVTIFDVLGMGKKVDESRLPPNPILDQFNGHVAVKGESWALPWKVKKDGGSVNYITGATISSRAVTDVTYRIARTFELKKKEIISGLAPASAGGEK